jgi:hypothetical protein
MRAAEATAEVFVMAFKALKPRERDAVLGKIMEDKALRESVADALLMEKQRREPQRPFREVVKELKIAV